MYLSKIKKVLKSAWSWKYTPLVFLILSIFLIVKVSTVSCSRSEKEIDKVETQVSVDYQLKYDSLVRVVSSVKVKAVQVEPARLDIKYSSKYSDVDRQSLNKNIIKTVETNIVKESDNIKKWQASYLNKEIDLKFDIVKDAKGISVPKLSYKLLKPTTSITTNVSNTVKTVANKHNFYMGGSTNVSGVGIRDLTPRLIYANNKMAFSLGHNIQGPGYNVEIGIYYKIF